MSLELEHIGEDHHMMLMRERWQGLAQATNPPVLPLPTKTQAQKPAAFTEYQLSAHHLPREMIFGDHPPLFPLLAAPS